MSLQEAATYHAVLHGTNQVHARRKENDMIYLDSPLVIALATLIGSIATLVWAFRRKA